MYYSLFDLRTAVRNKTDEYQTQRITDTELDGYIQDAIDHVHRIGAKTNERFFTKVSTTNLVSGSTEYMLPDDVYMMTDVDISTDNGNNYYRASEENIDMRNYSSSNNFIGGPYSFYYKGNYIVRLSTSHRRSTNGIRFVYEKQHYLLDAGAEFTSSVTEATRASNVISVETSAAHGVSVNDLITLYGMDDNSFDGTFRVTTVPTTTTLTCRQEGVADDATAGNTGTLYRRVGVDIPGGRTAKKLIEAYAARYVSIRDEKATSPFEEEIKFLGKEFKRILNPRTKAKNQRVRRVNTYRRWRR